MTHSRGPGLGSRDYGHTDMDMRALVGAGLRRSIPIGASVAFIVGCVLRYYYILVAHHPRHHVISDVRNMLGTAEKLLMGQANGDPRDTIWPPGTAALLAAFERIDPTLGAGAWMLFAQSVCVPILVAHTTKLLFGSRSAWIALGIASLHFGFIHYGGFFLSEQFFQFAMALALWQTVAVLAYVERRTAPQARPLQRVTRRELVYLLLLGTGVGWGWMYAASLRPTAMPTGLFVAIALALWAWKSNRQRVLLLLAGGVFASVVALIPLADRCTRLDGEDRCLISNNITMNMVLGQAGEVRGVTFYDPSQPERKSGWAPPSLNHHGYRGSRTVDFSIYDEKAALAWLMERFWEAPGAFIVRSVGNAADLFGVKYWPHQYAPARDRLATVASQLFLGLVIAPSFVAWVLLCRRLRFRVAPAEIVWLAAPVALLLSAAATMGEPRYRTPMDGIFIALAAAMYGRSLGTRQLPTASWKVLRVGTVAAGGFTFALLILVVLSSHPLILVLKQPDAHRGLRMVQTERQEELDASDLSRVRKAGSAWDASGNHVFACEPHCAELIVSFLGTVRQSTLELSLDSNDSYQIAYYRNGTLLAHSSVPQRRRKSMRIERLRVPKAARDEFDAIGVLPLHGDGRYSLGHVRTF